MNGWRLVLALAVLVGGACNRSDDGPVRVTVLAPSSMHAAFARLEEAFERTHADVQVDVTYGSSSRLVAQVEAGAPADVVATADAEASRRLQATGLVAPRPAARVFASTTMAVAVPAGNPKRLASVADLARPGLRVVLAAPEVPAGRYAADVLRKAGVTVTPASHEPDARAVVTKVAAGEADAALVYSSDLVAEPRLHALPLAPEHNVEVQYGIAVLAAAEDAGAAARFHEFVLSPAGRDILGRAGFLGAP